MRGFLLYLKKNMLKKLIPSINIENTNLKGMIFAGCSHTFGHGLWYYSGLKNIPNGDDNLNLFETKEAFVNYRLSNRFPRLVASHFNTYEITRKKTAGNDTDSIVFINEMIHNHYKFNEIDYVIFQTSFLERNPLTYVEKDRRVMEFRLSEHCPDGVVSDSAYNTLKEMNINTVDEYTEKLRHQMFTKIRDYFNSLEIKGIKCRLISYTNDYIDLIKADEFMFDRLIKLNYNGKEYDYILEMVNDYPNLLIINDHDYFGENTPLDYHPSKECHKIIADNIIKKIENDPLPKMIDNLKPPEIKIL